MLVCVAGECARLRTNHAAAHVVVGGRSAGGGGGLRCRKAAPAPTDAATAAATARPACHIHIFFSIHFFFERGVEPATCPNASSGDPTHPTLASSLRSESRSLPLGDRRLRMLRARLFWAESFQGERDWKSERHIKENTHSRERERLEVQTKRKETRGRELVGAEIFRFTANVRST